MKQQIAKRQLFRARLERKQKLMSYRWTSLALSLGRELVDLYLYITSPNYFSTTRSAFSSIFPLHVNYITPSALRKLAVARTEHLGLENTLKLANDDDEEERTIRVQSSSVATGISDHIPFGIKKVDLSASQRRIRLERLVTKLVGPFAELLADKNFIMSNDHPSSLDAIVLGFYGLTLDVKVSDPWAANIIHQKYPRFAKWVEKNAHKQFSKPHRHKKAHS
jgi:Outer mitochondrial membrane transport complex protein/Glutathione S-transferase, C-terminal domain